jgi:transcriptional regulator with XRE-family HTH domain
MARQMSLEPLQLHTPAEISRMLAERARELRLRLGLKQSTLARRAGITLASLRRFEQTGEASLSRLLQICQALGRLDEFAGLLQPPVLRTMKELELRSAQTARKRGSR